MSWRPSFAGIFFASTALLVARLAPAQAVPDSSPGQAAPVAVTRDGAAENPEGERAGQPERLSFRGTALSLDNSVSTHTVGIGTDYLSRNPMYELALGFRGRYYLWEPDDERSVMVAGSIAAVAELTNSDTATDQNEWTLTDAELLLGYNHRLVESGPYRTDLLVAVPTLSLPTSKVSASNGKILGLGLGGSLTETLPLREGETFLPQVRLRGRLGYTYQFTRAIVPTNEGIERVQIGPLGQTIPSDQLNGATFAQHQGLFSLAAGIDITDEVSWETEFGWRPSYKYSLPNEEICGVVLTGCVEPRTVEDPQDFSVITLFQTEIDINVPKPFNFAFGYQNVTLQLGPDGQRRNILYSPDARFFASIVLRLDELYEFATPARPERQASGAVFTGPY